MVPGNSGPSARFGGSAVFEPADRTGAVGCGGVLFFLGGGAPDSAPSGCRRNVFFGAPSTGYVSSYRL